MADGLRTQHIGELNFAHLRAFISGMVTVAEQEIVAAMRAVLLHAKLVAEPSGAVALAAALYRRDLPQRKTVCVILSGGNMQPETLLAALEPQLAC